MRLLQHLGVRVRPSMRVQDIRRGEVELNNGEIIRAKDIFWTAGVSAVPITKKLGVDPDKAGRIKMNPGLSVLIQWTYSFFTYKRGARIVAQGVQEKHAGPVGQSGSPSN